MMDDGQTRGLRGSPWLLLALSSVLATGCYRGVSDDGPGADGADGSGSADGADDGGDDGPEPGEQCLEDGEFPDTLVRRLTVEEYVNTIQDVLQVDVSADAALIPEDIRTEGFSNNTASLLVTFSHVEAYNELAAIIVGDLGDMTGFVGQYTACTEFNAMCQGDLVRNLGLRLYRRPLSEEEVAEFGPLWTAAQEEGEGFNEAAGLVLRTMLQAPQFIYRLEDETPDGSGDATRKLDGYEVASRLSYFIWSSAPDDDLYGAAAADELRTIAQVGAQVERMLELPRARETSRRYIADWLALNGLIGINRDPALYPDFTPDLADDMRDETLAMFENLVWEDNLPMFDIMSAQYTYASRELAEFYGFANPQDGVNRYDLTDDPRRAGVMTHAGVLALNGHGNRPSIVERGLFVLRSVLCAEVPAPPANVDTSMSDIDPDASEREKSTARLDNATCYGCHGNFDPMGYAFEVFDGVGQYQTMDDLGNQLKEDGWLLDPPTGEQLPYNNVSEFVALVASNESARACVTTRKPLQFAIARPLVPADDCTLDGIKMALEENGPTYQSLIVAIATHPSFRRVRTQE